MKDEEILQLVTKLIAEGDELIKTRFQRLDIRFRGGDNPHFVNPETYHQWKGRCRLLLQRMGSAADPWKTDIDNGKDTSNRETTALRILGALKSIKQSMEEKVLNIAETVPAGQNQSNKVFLVHGHNHGVLETVARFLGRLSLVPIILHEQPNKGRTLIEKFHDYSDVGFAVVLLTADDNGKANKGKTLKPRARQNVVFELGFFLGKLGREKVCALYEKGVELPSDMQGVIYLSLTEDWKTALVRELKAAKFNVDANAIFV